MIKNEKLESTAKAFKGSGARSMAELLASHSAQFAPIKKGDIVSGTIKKLTPKEILVDIQGKGDALVIEYDKKNLESLLAIFKVGDTVNVSVISPESEEGFPIVSLRRTLESAMYKDFEDLFKSNEPFTVQILDATRGGYFIQTPSGVKGFLPNSQVLPIEASLTGKNIEVKIIEFDREKKRVVVSQKATQYVTDIDQISKAAPRDSIVEGEVTSVTPYGLYITLEPKKGTIIEGFIHISEISYDRIENLVELYKKGDKVKAQILEVDRENRRVNASIKKLQADTFDQAKTQFPKEKKIKAKVLDARSRGVTLDLGEHVKGFIPTAKLESGVSYAPGQEVNVEVADYDERRRIVLVTPVLSAKPMFYR